MPEKDKYVLFICGGKWQEPWLLYLKNKGHKILLVDPFDTPVCIKHADIFFQCDAKDTDSILKNIHQNNYEIEFVTSEQTDISTLPVAILSKALNKKGNEIESVQKFSNKFISREFARNISNEHVPQFIKARTLNEVLAFRNLINNSIIIKPVDAQSSRGIFKIETNTPEEEIEKNIHEALRFSSQTYFIAEEFITGDEITLEGICIHNKHTTLTGSNKKHFRMGIASELVYPLKNNSGFLNDLVLFHNNLIEQSGFNFGITHTEYLINEEKNQFYLVEMACRGGGSLIPSHIVPWVTGVNAYDILYLLITDQPVATTPENLKSVNAATLHFFEFKTGKVKSIHGLEECKNIQGVNRMELEFIEGSTIYPATDDRGRQGYVIVMAHTYDEANTIIKNIYATLRIEYV